MPRQPCALVSADRFDWVDHADRPYDAVGHVDVLPSNRCHIVAAVVDDKWHADVGLLPQLLPLHVSGDVDEDDDNRSVGVPLVAAGRLPLLFADCQVRYRLMTIFSKNHLLPKFCIVCLRLHIYRYLGLEKLKSLS